MSIASEDRWGPSLKLGMFPETGNRRRTQPEPSGQADEDASATKRGWRRSCRLRHLPPLPVTYSFLRRGCIA